MSRASQISSPETNRRALLLPHLALIAGGWYFNIFTTHDTAIGITSAQAKARCFDACHKAQEARDYVFSDPRR